MEFPGVSFILDPSQRNLFITLLTSIIGKEIEREREKNGALIFLFFSLRKWTFNQRLGWVR